MAHDSGPIEKAVELIDSSLHAQHQGDLELHIDSFKRCPPGAVSPTRHASAASLTNSTPDSIGALTKRVAV
jgi:hypothetical protein